MKRKTFAAAGIAAVLFLSGCINIYTDGSAAASGSGEESASPDITADPSAKLETAEETEEVLETEQEEQTKTKGDTVSVKWIISPSMPVDQIDDPVQLLPSSSDYYNLYEGPGVQWADAVYYTGNVMYFGQNGKEGIMDYDGNVLIPAVFTKTSWGNAFAICQYVMNGIYGDINSSDMTAYLISSDFRTFSYENLLPTGLDVIAGFYTCNDRVYSDEGPLDEKSIPSDLCNKILVMKDTNGNTIGAQYVDSSGNTGAKWNYLMKDKYSCNGYAAVYKADDDRNSIGLVDISTGKLITSEWYQYSKWFEDGYCPVRKDGKWGYIDTEGNEVTDFIFEDASVSYNGRVFVKLNGKYGILDLKNTLEEKIAVTEETCASWTDNSKLRDANEVVGKVKVNVSGLNIRKLPNASSDKAGKTENGKSYDVYDIYNGATYTWYRIGDGQWIADNGSWVTYKEG